MVVIAHLDAAGMYRTLPYLMGQPGLRQPTIITQILSQNLLQYYSKAYLRVLLESFY
jgi:hypothetical protein